MNISTKTCGYFTIKQAAATLNIPYWKLLRAVNGRIIPHHKLLNSTRYVKIQEIEAAMQEAAGHVPDTASTTSN